MSDEFDFSLDMDHPNPAQLCILDIHHCPDCQEGALITHPGCTKCWFHKRGSDYFCFHHKRHWPASDVTQEELDYRVKVLPNGKIG